MSSSSKVRLSVAQLPHINYDVAGNIQRGVKAVEEAASTGAQLVLLPEFFSTGYMFTTELWEMAEVLHGGPTLTAMKEVATRCNICVGFTILEARKDSSSSILMKSYDFYNTFVLVEPKGQIHICHKSEPAALEAYLFKGDSSMSPIFETETFGKIAVSICYENMLLSHQKRLLSSQDEDTKEEKMKTIQADRRKKTPFNMILCPHSAPTTDECRSFSHENVLAMNIILEQTPMRLSKIWGVPVLMSNKIGPMKKTKYPFPFGLLIPSNHTFMGYSSICAGDNFWLIAARNELNKEKIEDRQEVIAANTFIGEDNRKLVKAQEDLEAFGNNRYVVTLPSPLPFVWTNIMEPMGKLSYKMSYMRRRAAVERAIQRGSDPSTYQPSSSGGFLSFCILATAAAAATAVVSSGRLQKKP